MFTPIVENLDECGLLYRLNSASNGVYYKIANIGLIEKLHEMKNILPAWQRLCNNAVIVLHNF